MKILSVDTSANICNINLIEDGKVLKYLELEEDITHAKKLMPGIDNVLKGTNIKLKDIDLFGCIIGPGSFTGLRIGVSAMKAFSLALNKNIIPATSLELLEENAIEEMKTKEEESIENIIISVIDARNKEVYGSISYTGEMQKKENFAGNILDFMSFIKNILESKDKDKVQKTIHKEKINIYIVGNGKKLFEDELENYDEKEYFEKYNLIYVKDEKQRGKYLGRLMEKNIAKNVEGEKLMPLYLKPSGIKTKKAKKL